MRKILLAMLLLTLSSPALGQSSFLRYHDLRDLRAQAQATPDMTVAVASGEVYVGGTQVSYAGGDSPTFTAPGSDNRIDLLALDADGVLNVTTGTAAGTPSAPTFPLDELPICLVYLKDTSTSIQAYNTGTATHGYIQTDVRPFVNHRGIDFTQLHLNYVIPSTALAHYTVLDAVVDATAQDSSSHTHVLDVALADGLTGFVAALGTHPGVDPLHQHIGTFTSFGGAYAGRLVGATYTDDIDAQNIWVAATDSILVGHTALFDEIELDFTTPATKDCKLEFYYYKTGVGWTQFYPADDTRGGRQDGTIRFNGADLTAWQSDYDPGTGADAGYWLNIKRTRVSTPGTVTLATGKYLIATTYEWDSSGVVSIASLTAGAAAGITLGADASPNVPGYIKMFSDGDDAFFNTFTSGDNTANATYTLPVAMPASNKVLQSTSGGVLSWISALGDVVGPASSTDHAIARWDLTTGKLLQDTANAILTDAGLLTLGSNLIVDGGDIGLTADPDLIGLASGALTVNGSGSFSAAPPALLVRAPAASHASIHIDPTDNTKASFVYFRQAGVAGWHIGYGGSALAVAETGIATHMTITKISGDVTIPTGALSAGADTDTLNILGRAKIGYFGVADVPAFAHHDFFTTASAALKQNASGDTVLNAHTGRGLYLRVDNAGGLVMTAAALYPSADSAMTCGSATKYWSNTYTDRIYLNATAYLDGTSAGSISLAGTLIANATSITTDTTTGLKIGTSANQKIGFFNATPVVQQGPLRNVGEDGQTVEGAITEINNLLEAFGLSE